jgi:hypothetical protein
VRVKLVPKELYQIFVHLHPHHLPDDTWLTKQQLESIIQAAASLPTDSKACKDLSGLLIKPLWNDLHHPPLCYLGNEFKYRKSDGSNNNFMYPHMGAAGSPYARTVTPQTLAPSVLPDAGLVFDTIFARGERPKKHPNHVSSFLFYLASIITHGKLTCQGFCLEAGLIFRGRYISNRRERCQQAQELIIFGP